jgi:UDP-N-acetylglucosamine 4,6-dehydratase
MRREFPGLSYVLGDVRDRERVRAVVAGHNIVFHLAAMKRIPECEAQPYECWQTNVVGSQNVIEACQAHNVDTCVGISTDKACQAVTMYGASKFAMEKLFQAQRESRCRFVLARYGNVIESRGSVILLWRKQVAEGLLPTITDRRMTRFWITPEQAVDIALSALSLENGCVYVPKMHALNIVDMARYATQEEGYREIGLRSAERLHEWVVSPDERATEHEDHYVVSEAGTFGHSHTSANAPCLNMAMFRQMLEGIGL